MTSELTDHSNAFSLCFFIAVSKWESGGLKDFEKFAFFSQAPNGHNQEFGVCTRSYFKDGVCSANRGFCFFKKHHALVNEVVCLITQISLMIVIMFERVNDRIIL